MPFRKKNSAESLDVEFIRRLWIEFPSSLS
jgi:hypothetical protein